MPRRFFTRRIPIVHNVAMLLLCIIFFLLPFALRGARFALEGMQNNVADWLPKNFQETVDLVEFRKYFIGDQFVVISGPWCREGNPAYDNLKRKIFEESLAYEKELRAQNDQERIRAMHAGDKYGLLYAGNFHEEWGQYRERWLKGSGGKWFFINRNGELYEWHGQNNVVEGFSRMLERMANGRNQAVGTLIDTFGPPPDDSRGQSNPYYENPQLICARAFKSVTSGPEAFEQMAGKNGTLRIGKFGEEDAVTLEAKIEAHKRLTGALFGPTPPEKFSWTFDSLLQNIDDKVLISQLKNDAIFRTKFEKFIEHQITTSFDGDRARLEATDADGRLAMWYRMWDAMDLEAPSRQTCLIATINDPFLTELDRIVGRPLMGKPRGRLLELATGECGLDKENVHLGGPPVDNVSIDEEGSSSLLKLASLSGLVGIIMSYYAFRSIRVTLMLFFVGSMSAISSLAYVWFGGDRLDAILLTMPSLVYVLAMAGSVHMVHYYKHAVEKNGRKRAVETAIRYGWFPCFLVAFTDSIALFSLCTSNLKPIYHFGLYSGIATLGTLFFIYAFLPSALTIWPPHYHREPKKEEKDPHAPEPFSRRFWGGLCDFVTKNHVPIVAISAVALVICLFGVAKIKTTVQLLKLFDKNAKILQDYRWMEANVGKLVPMEVVLTVDAGAQREGWVERQRKPSEQAEIKVAGNGGNDQPQAVVVANATEEPIYDKLEFNLKYSFLERLELSQRVRRHLERFFGPTGLDIVGSGMSTDVFVPMQNVNSQVETSSNLNPRKAFNTQLIASRPAMLAEDYLEITDTKVEPEVGPAYYTEVPEYNGREMWRISLRLAGLNDVDYGHFVHNLKMVVEPIVKAYEFRSTILKEIQAVDGESSLTEGRILLLGRNPDAVAEKLALERKSTEADLQSPYDQAYLFADTLQDLLENRGYEPKTGKKAYMWVDPSWYTAENPFPANERWADHLRKFDCVVLVEDHAYFDSEFIKQNSNLVVDCRAHRFDIDLKKSSQKLPLTAMQRKIEKGQGSLDVAAIYTGIVPIVYKAQGALLSSLIESTAWSFGSIALIMMILLRKWNGRLNPGNWINFRGGLVAMVPNVFPIILIFGIIGFLGVRVDIGSMMTASVAMGIAVDDTIHFMNWYVRGMEQGMNRKQAIKFAYTSCADGMAQTGLIVGCGLFVFALSTFAPTQKFGVLMLVLLNAATLGDLLLLPALLAGPLGKYVCAESPRSQVESVISDSASSELDDHEINVIAIPSVGQSPRKSETTTAPFGSIPKEKKRFGKQQ